MGRGDDIRCFRDTNYISLGQTPHGSQTVVSDRFRRFLTVSTRTLLSIACPEKTPLTLSRHHGVSVHVHRGRDLGAPHQLLLHSHRRTGVVQPGTVGMADGTSWQSSSSVPLRGRFGQPPTWPELSGGGVFWSRRRSAPVSSEFLPGLSYRRAERPACNSVYCAACIRASACLRSAIRSSVSSIPMLSRTRRSP